MGIDEKIKSGTAWEQDIGDGNCRVRLDIETDSPPENTQCWLVIETYSSEHIAALNTDDLIDLGRVMIQTGVDLQKLGVS